MKKRIIQPILFVAFVATLFSFTGFGGEGFEIYLNNKMVLQQYGNNMNEIKSLHLDPQTVKAPLTVKYHHCGHVAKNRVITIKNLQNKVVKEWRFADASVPLAPMNCNVKEIVQLNKGNENTFQLYYSSTELPKGRLLTKIVVENQPVVAVVR